jgi:hypothetical protein
MKLYPPSHPESTSCPTCGAPTIAVRCAPLHYFEPVCAGCRRFLNFVPRPVEIAGPPPDEFLDLARAVTAERPLARLRGASQSQVAMAVAVRSTMIREALDRSDFEREVILGAIADATWFCAYASKTYDGIRWPTVEQLVEGGRS